MNTTVTNRTNFKLEDSLLIADAMYGGTALKVKRAEEAKDRHWAFLFNDAMFAFMHLAFLEPAASLKKMKA
jgi:hypothetical protein